MTTDEELAHLEDGIRRLKVEYDVYFGGGSNKAPAELGMACPVSDQEIFRQP